MDGDVENRDVSGGNCYINSHTLSEANNPSSVDSTKKRNGNVTNVYELDDTVLQDCADIDAIFLYPH